MGGEFTPIIYKVSTCCDLDAVGVPFVWSKVNNGACISYRLCFLDAGDFFVSHNED
jgi:hypothetical protein